MGDLNQIEFLKKNKRWARGPILEIGSRDYGNTPDYRTIFPGEEYLGADLSAGEGVDLVFDASADFEKIITVVGNKRFNTIICFSVLEHCADPFAMSRNLEKLLDHDGALFLSVPFSWEYHEFPQDYWRFTPSAVRLLFPNLLFLEDETFVSTSNPGEMKRVDDKEFYKLDLSPKAGMIKKRYGFFTGVMIKLIKTFHLLDPVLQNIYVMPPVLIHMVGRKKPTG